MKHLYWLLFCLTIAMAGPAYGASPPGDSGSPAKVEVPADDLKRLVDLLEDDKKREVFVRDLKTLIRLQEGVASPGGPTGEPTAPPTTPTTPDAAKVIKPISKGIDSFAETVVEEVGRIAWQVSRLPTAVGRAGSFLTDQNNRFELLILALDIGVGILAAVCVALLGRRYRPRKPEHPLTLTGRLGRGCLEVLIKLAPYLALLLTVFALFEVHSLFSPAKNIVKKCLWGILFYQLAKSVLLTILAPSTPLTRILPYKDQDASFIWVWTRRLVQWSLFYYLLVEALLGSSRDRILYLLVRDLLLFVFPILLTIFIIKAALRFRSPEIAGPAEPGPDTPGLKWPWIARIGRLLRHYWAIPALAYVWAISLSAIGRYTAVFSYLLWSTVGTLAVITGAAITWAGLGWSFPKFLPQSLLEGRFGRIVRAAALAIIVILSIAGLGAVWDIHITSLTARYLGPDVLARTLAIVMTVGVVAAVMGSSQLVTNVLLREKEGQEPSQKVKTLTPILNTMIKAGAVFVGGIIVLERIGVDVGPILAGAGIIGIGIGLGAQSLVKDIINGVFILAQDMISVGDWVQLGSKSGLVEAIGLRATRLRDTEGNVHIIPNSAIDSVTNMTKVFSRYVFDVHVSYKEDVDQVMTVLEELGREMQADSKFGPDILQPLEILGLDKFADSAVVIRARVTTKPMKQWEVGREFNRRIKKTFDRLGIEIPFPHRTIYMGETKGPSSADNGQLPGPAKT